MEKSLENKVREDFLVDFDDLYEIDLIKNHLSKDFKQFEWKWNNCIEALKKLEIAYDKAFSIIKERIDKFFKGEGIKDAKEVDSCNREPCADYQTVSEKIFKFILRANFVERYAELKFQPGMQQNTGLISLSDNYEGNISALLNSSNLTSFITALNSISNNLAENDGELTGVISETKKIRANVIESYAEIKNIIEFYERKVILKRKCRFMGYSKDETKFP